MRGCYNGQSIGSNLGIRVKTNHRTFVSLTMLAGLCCVAGGCIVGQAPGNGKVLHLREPTTGGSYYLYLPEDYVKGGKPPTGERWPLVVTFHGMRPFDDAGSQIREWQQEADRYGFVVIAPKTATSDLLRQFASVRVRSVHAGVRRDEALTLAAMDDVCRRVDIDPTKVLTTSWSSGGYLAHYMVNQHPERFSCIAPRQSNFSSDVLEEAQVPRYRDVKVGIFYTENDFAICQRESQEGAQWYASRGFDVTFAVFRDLGHARRPSVAADFFARQIGVPAKTPPIELTRMQVTRIPLNGAKISRRNGEAARSGKVAAAQLTGNADSGGDVNPADGRQPAAPRQPRAGTQAAPKPRSAESGGPVPGGASAIAAEPKGKTLAGTGQPAAESDGNALHIRVSSTIGIAPHHLNFSAVAPAELARGAYFLWTDNGEPIANGVNGQKFLIAPGEHELAVTMTTAEGRRYVARRTITVLERMAKGSAE